MLVRMMKTFMVTACMLSLAACENSQATDTSTPSDVDLPNLIDDLDPEGCDTVDGTPHVGASSYFYGVLSLSESTWFGTESWILYANSSWQDQGQDDCQIVWDIQASEVGISSCGTCDLGLSVNASVDVAQSDCPDELYAGSEHFTVGYDIRRSDDGSATWFFSSNGEQLGTGYHEDDSLNYITTQQCLWF